MFASQEFVWLRNIESWQNKQLLFIGIYLCGLGFVQQLYDTHTGWPTDKNTDDLLRKMLKTHTVILLNILFLHGKECCRRVWIESWMSYWLTETFCGFTRFLATSSRWLLSIYHLSTFSSIHQSKISCHYKPYNLNTWHSVVKYMNRHISYNDYRSRENICSWTQILFRIEGHIRLAVKYS